MSDSKFNPEIIRQLAEVLHETCLNEIKYETSDVKIEIVRHNRPELSTAVTTITPASIAVHSVSDIDQDAESTDISQHPGAVKSPMVGNVYLASEPGALPFVQEGDSVAEGQTLLIIEAMKVMNPIRAPRKGIVKKIMVNNAAPVEFDEVLMIIE